MKSSPAIPIPISTITPPYPPCHQTVYPCTLNPFVSGAASRAQADSSLWRADMVTQCTPAPRAHFSVNGPGLRQPSMYEQGSVFVRWQLNPQVW